MGREETTAPRPQEKRSDKMATTAQEVFDAAMGLMGEVETSTGDTDTADTAQYKAKTLFILNVLLGEVYPYSDTYKASGGKRPACAAVTDFAGAVPVDDVIARTILPYGLASELLLEEDPALASYFRQRFDELIVRLGSGVPGVFEQIGDVYGIAELGEFGRW